MPTAARQRIVFRTEVFDANNAGPQRTVVHELGHTLGLYHEHARWQQNSVTDENKALCKPTTIPWRAVTPADPDSVMGYTSCDDINDISEPRLSAGDRQGLHYLYSVPRTGELHFDAGPTDDILWVDPINNSLSVWYGGSNGSNITFDSVGPFTPPGTMSRRVKPLAVKIDSEPMSHVLLHAPGGPLDDPDGGTPQNDMVLVPDPSIMPPFAASTYGKEQPERYAYPILGRFLDVATEEVWWLLPGADGDRSDLMWKFITSTESTVDNNSYDSSFSSDNYLRPLVGSWVAGGTPDGQVVWWREGGASGAREFRFMGQNLGMDGFTGDATGFTPCGITQSSEYTPLTGNFDGDSEWEIFWVSARTSTHVMWWNVEEIAEGSCGTADFSAFSFDTPTFFKPFIGRFNDDGTNDVFWYRGGHPLSPEDAEDAEPEQVWYFADNSSHDVEVLALAQDVNGDFSPYVGDFDGDGCEDVLWFAPHTEVSPLSRARCTAPPTPSEGFDDQPAQDHPQTSYPVGYARTRARR